MGHHDGARNTCQNTRAIWLKADFPGGGPDLYEAEGRAHAAKALVAQKQLTVELLILWLRAVLVRVSSLVTWRVMDFESLVQGLLAAGLRTARNGPARSTPQ